MHDETITLSEMQPEGFAPIPEGESGNVVSVIGAFRLREPEMARRIEGRPCRTCNATPGQLCRKASGRVAWYHVPRTGDWAEG
jgi:hypothetical protein